MTLEERIEQLKDKARASWRGNEGERRAERLEAFLRKRLPEYAAAFDATETEVLEALERQRDYSAVNFYQDANLPSLDGVRVFANEDELKAMVPSRQFRCPSCEGASTNPYECNASEACDWKAYGLFRTMGKGLRFTIKDQFLQHAMIDEIFMPIDLEPTPQEHP